MTLSAWPIDNHASDAQVIRQQVGSLVGAAGGLVAAGNLEVTQKGTPTMAVLVAAGSCWVPGFSAGGVNPYFFNNSASYEQAITAANGSNPRVDRIIARIVDEAYEGSGHEPVIEALAGTPETGATLGNRKGAAAAPAAAITLAFVLVPAKATSIVTADIENVASVFIMSGAVGGWQTFTLGPKLEAYGSSPTPGWRLEQGGNVVRLRGAVKPKSGESVKQGERLFQMPTAGIPANTQNISAMIFNTSTTTPNMMRLLVTASGEAIQDFLLSGSAIAEQTFVMLDGITYPLT